jgi:hypothetical protein
VRSGGRKERSGAYCHYAHAKDPELESDEGDVLAFGVEESLKNHSSSVRELTLYPLLACQQDSSMPRDRHGPESRPRRRIQGHRF